MHLEKPLAAVSLLLATLMLCASGCVVEPREGYYDAAHHRWYHEHGWVPCGDADEHCRR